MKGGETMFIKLLQKMRSQKGFTLIELVFVVVILAILAGVALINLGGTDVDAKKAAVKSDMRTLATAIKVYKAKKNSFPNTLADLATDSDPYKAMIDAEPDDASADSSTSYGYTSSTDLATITCAKNWTTMVVK
jgi:prepilin-type N-terminal cleavage/methylation domain-containing protein